MKAFYLAGAGPQEQTLSGLLGIPTWAVIGILIVIAVVGFIIGTRLERAHGGALSAEQLTEPEVVSRVEAINIVSLRVN